MHHTQVVIIGGGISGLYAATLLKNLGVDYLLVESKNNLGGRAISVYPENPSELGSGIQKSKLMRVDVGATWVWPQIQPQLAEIMNGLGLELIAQNESGYRLLEQNLHTVPLRQQSYGSYARSMRIIGGMELFVEKLTEQSRHNSINLGWEASSLHNEDDSIQVHCIDASGKHRVIVSNQVLLAVPPRVAIETIKFYPSLPLKMVDEWKATGTWMAQHAKYIATYSEAFWQDQSLSGEANSTVGPLVEIHDATVPGGVAALFGFFGMPVQNRVNLPDNVLKEHCRNQLARLFGPQAATPLVEIIQDWALDPYVATESDTQNYTQHFAAPSPTPTQGVWAEHLYAIASEWSVHYPGYLAGAIEAATQGAIALMSWPTSAK